MERNEWQPILISHGKPTVVLNQLELHITGKQIFLAFKQYYLLVPCQSLYVYETHLFLLS